MANPTSLQEPSGILNIIGEQTVGSQTTSLLINDPTRMVDITAQTMSINCPGGMINVAGEGMDLTNVANGLSLFSTPLVLDNFSRIVTSYNPPSLAPSCRVNIEPYSGYGSGDVIASFDGQVEASSFVTLIPVSHRRLKRDIVSAPLAEDLGAVDLVRYRYDLDAIQKEYGEEVLSHIPTAEQRGAILEDVPVAYHRESRWLPGASTLAIEELQFDLVAYLLIQRRQHISRI